MFTSFGGNNNNNNNNNNDNNNNNNNNDNNNNNNNDNSNNIAVLNDSGIFEKEKEKIEKYQDLRREAKLWSIKTSVVPTVVGALGTITNNLGKHLKTIGVTATVELFQKAALLGTARILRKGLEA